MTQMTKREEASAEQSRLARAAGRKEKAARDKAEWASKPTKEKNAMKEYAFDVRLFATIRVNAETVLQARTMLMAALDCADTNFGAWPNGDPITAEASWDGPMDLIEIDGEAV